jgi:site-specific recombinase XerD
VATISLLEATGRIQEYLSNRGKSDNTTKAYLTDVKMFFLETGIAEISVQDLETRASAWLNARRREVAPKTLGRRLTSMRAFGRCLGIQILAEYSAPTPARSMPHPLPGLLEDIKKMLAVAKSEQQRSLLALCGLCGLRITEAREVEPDDFDLHNMTLTVRGKGDKTRIVPVSKMAWSVLCPTVLEARMVGRKSVVVLTDRHAREIITQLGVRAGVKRPVASHDLRATFATVAYNNSNKNIRAVQDLLGHASVVQTQLYTGVTMDSMRAAVSFDLDEEDE